MNRDIFPSQIFEIKDTISPFFLNRLIQYFIYLGIQLNEDWESKKNSKETLCGTIRTMISSIKPSMIAWMNPGILVGPKTTSEKLNEEIIRITTSENPVISNVAIGLPVLSAERESFHSIYEVTVEWKRLETFELFKEGDKSVGTHPLIGIQ